MPLVKQTDDKIGLEEYLQSELMSDVKHEYVQGYVYAMTGASDSHNRISSNLVGEFHSKLKSSSCITYGSDMKIKAANDIFYPDAMIVCDNEDNESDYYKKSPLIIVEVLSKSTRKRDQTTKKIAYMNITTLEEYVLIEQDFCEIEVFRKKQGWQSSFYYLGDEISFDSLAISLSVADIYHRVENEDMAVYIKQSEKTGE